MTGAWRITVRQFVHQNKGGAAGEGGVEIELRHQPATMADTARGLRGKPLQQRRGLFTAVGFHHADENIEPLSPQSLSFCQHGEGFPDARAGAEEDFQFATMGFSCLFEQPVRIRAQGLVGHLVFP